MTQLVPIAIVVFGLSFVAGLLLWKLVPSLNPLVAAACSGAVGIFVLLQAGYDENWFFEPRFAGVILGAIAGFAYLEWRKLHRPAVERIQKRTVVIAGSVAAFVVVMFVSALILEWSAQMRRQNALRATTQSNLR
jgi:hypothetical protein